MDASIYLPEQTQTPAQSYFTWWDESQDWTAATDIYKQFRRDQQGRRGKGVVVLYVKKKIDVFHRAVLEKELRNYG